jgi:hypothetical protein
MFTFCAGFEAATLKIPNKEYTAYGNANGPGSLRSGTNGLSSNYPQSFTGPNDPYNLVTVNQGGVVVDGGRDGPLASWPTSVPGMLQEDGGHFVPGGGSMQTMPPRKQIIGFAKFRSRSEALEARDVLQGRRVDIEKGAVLKAEMAKKNLHTKRGVGPLPLQLPGVMGNGGGTVVAQESMTLTSGLNATVNGMAAIGLNPAMETLSSRDRELGALGAMGLGAISQWRETTRIPESEEERDRRRDREAGVLNAMGLGVGARGPRERAEEDERERERRRKEKEARSRLTLSAFDAFHSVPPQTISRHPSNSLLSRSASIDNGALANPLMANGLGVHMLTQSSVVSQEDRFASLAGPWDSITSNGSRKANISLSNAPIRPPSASRQSPPSNQDSSPFHSVTDLPAHQHLSLPRAQQYSPTSEFLDSQQYSAHSHSHLSASSSPPESAASSVVDGSQVTDPDEVPRAPLAVSTSKGDSSPELPSPDSGSSSTGARNLVDQNPPVSFLVTLHQN